MADTRLPPFPETAIVSEKSGAMSLPMRQNDEDIKRQLAAALVRITALEDRVTVLEGP
jgi:hypothetical protein